MTQPGATGADPSAGSPSTGESLVGFFTRALEDYRRSNDRFRVLCSVVPPAACSPAPAPGSALIITEEDEPVPAPALLASRPRHLVVLDSSFNPPTAAHLGMAATAASGMRSGSDSSSSSKDRTSLHHQRGERPRRILLLLATNNADKAPRPAAFPHRLAMMCLFARDLADRVTGAGDEGAGTGADWPVDIGVTTEPYFHSKSEAVAESRFYRPNINANDDTANPSSAAAAADPSSDMEQVYLVGFDTLIRIFNPKYYPSPDPSAPSAMAAALDPFFARARLQVTVRADADAEWGDAAAQRAYMEGLGRGSLVAVGGRAEWATRVARDPDADAEEQGEGPLPAISSTKVREAIARGHWAALKTDGFSVVTPRVEEFIRREGLYREG